MNANFKFTFEQILLKHLGNVFILLLKNVKNNDSLDFKVYQNVEQHVDTVHLDDKE